MKITNKNVPFTLSLISAFSLFIGVVTIFLILPLSFLLGGFFDNSLGHFYNNFFWAPVYILFSIGVLRFKKWSLPLFVAILGRTIPYFTRLTLDIYKYPYQRIVLQWNELVLPFFIILASFGCILYFYSIRKKFN